MTDAEFFDQLRRECLTEGVARVGELRADIEAVRAGRADALKSLKLGLHRLAGSGGSYGFPQITAASRAAEEQAALAASTALSDSRPRAGSRLSGCHPRTATDLP